MMGMTGIWNLTAVLGSQVMGLYGRWSGYGGGYSYGYGYLSYLIFLLPALILGAYAQGKVKRTFGRYNKVTNSRRMTGAQMARMVLDQNRLTYVRVEHINGELTDHYDPRDHVVRLSSSVYDSTSIGAIGVAAHEAGHAVQHAEEYTPIKVRNSILPVCNFGSQAGPVLIMLGCLFAGSTWGRSLIFFGIVLFSMVALFQLVTLPVEFDASSRGLAAIRESGMFTEDDVKGAGKVLKAAALTYVAALVTSIMQILYYVTRYLGRGSRRRQ